MRDLLVAEEFLAPQGEGRNTGRMSYWVRCGGCNQTCRWCDTPYTWAFTERQAGLHESGKVYDPAEELHRETLEDITRRVKESQAGAVTFTGGEPLLQAGPLSRLVDGLWQHRIEVETAGTVSPGPLAMFPVQYTVSPKLQSSGNPVELRRNPEVIREFLSLDAVFKFVIDTRDEIAFCADLAEASQLVNLWQITGNRVWLSPCGTTLNQVVAGMEKLEPVCAATGWNLSSRLQVLMHGDERGH